MIPVLLGAGALALAIVLSLGISVWRHQQRMLFQPPAAPWATADTVRLDQHASDGQALFAWLVEPDASSGTEPRRLLISVHGNAEIAAWGVPWAK